MKVLLFVLCAVATASRVSENPLGKVISLLDSLTAKITADGEAEAKAYHEFFEWCDDAATEKNHEIETASKAKAKQEAALSKSAADAQTAAAEIESLSSSIAGDEADLKSATGIREKESSDFAADEAELLGTIDTLKRAIGIIGKEMAKNPAAFAQVDISNLSNLAKSLGAVIDAASFSGADKEKLVALVQGTRQESALEDELTGAPAAATYKSHSSNILDVLEDLKDKAEEQLSDLRKAETTAKHNFAMLKQSLEDQVAASTKNLGEERASMAASESAKATAASALAAANTDLADAKKALATANSDCIQTAADHEATVNSRNEELAVIAKAKEILSAKTSGAVDKTYSLVQVGRQSRLRAHADLAGAEVVTMVKRLASKHHSAALAQLASRINAVMRYGASAGEDPFKKVKTLITGLITRLEAEAAADATEKAYCDEQMADTAAKKTELQEDLAKLAAKISQATARTATLKDEVKELQAELAELAKEQAMMDKMRQEENAAYKEAKADLEQGLEGVRMALGVLREHYGSGSEEALLQGGVDVAVDQPAKPELHAKAGGAGNSIIGILEVIESDFAKNLAKEETEESDGAEFYEKTTQENTVTKKLKDQDVKYKTLEIKKLAETLSGYAADKDTLDTELAAVLEYDAKIKARCVAKPETYAERKARREAEIAGLKEALSVLEDETAAFVQRKRRGLRQQPLEA